MSTDHLVMSETDFSVFDYQFSQIAGVILEAKGLHFDQDFLEEISNQAILYIHELVKTLGKFTEIQRRTQPSASDVLVTLEEHGINASQVYDVHTELVRLCVKENGTCRQQLETIAEKTRDISRSILETTADYDETDPSHPFFSNEHYEITELVPQQSSKPKYIPEYFPDLPPDFTYHTTPQYMKMLTDMKEMRLKLVDESRMQENSLYVLMDDEEIRWKDKFEVELKEMESASENGKTSDEEDDIMSESHDDNKMNNNTDVESPMNVAEPVKHIEIPANNEHEKNEVEAAKEAEAKDIESTIQPEPVGAVEKPEVISKEVEIGTETENEAQTAIEDVVVVEPTVAEKPSVELVAEEAEVPKSIPETQKIDNVSFDIELYARRRLALKREREAQIEERFNKRTANVFLRAEQYFSPYAVQPANDEIKKEFLLILEQEFKLAIKSIRKAEAKKKHIIERILRVQAQKERERELEREKTQFGFSFGGNQDSSSDSDSDDGFGDNNNFPMFGFGPEGDDDLMNTSNTKSSTQEDIEKQEHGENDDDVKDTGDEMMATTTTTTNINDHNNDDDDDEGEEEEEDDDEYNAQQNHETDPDNISNHPVRSIGSKTISIPSFSGVQDSEVSEEDEEDDEHQHETVPQKLQQDESEDDDFLEAELENAMFEHSQDQPSATVSAPDRALDLDSDSDVDMEDV